MESVFRIVLVVVLFFVLTSEFNLILSHVYDRFRTVSAAHGKSESATILADATGGKSVPGSEQFPKESINKAYFSGADEEESEENYGFTSKFSSESHSKFCIQRK